MSRFSTNDDDFAARLATADVIFITQDGYRQASARVRCYNFAAALRREGLRAETLSFYDHLGAADQGGHVSSIPEEEKLALNLKAYSLLAANPRAVLYLQKVTYPALAAILAAARNGNPIVLDYDDYEIDTEPFRRLGPWLPSLQPRPLFAEVTRRAAACVAASRRIVELMAPFNPNIHLIHTVADQTAFNLQNRAAPRRRLGDAVNIIYSGDFWGDIPMKDALFALDAFVLTPRAAQAQARFHIVGFGRAWEAFKARAHERFAHTDRIIFHEFIPPVEMPGVLGEADIGVLPYSVNDFNTAKSPTKMFEYLLAGVTVLATSVGEAVHCLEGRRFGVIADGLEAYADGMARLITDHNLRRGLAAAACDMALERYSLQGAGPRLADIVRKAMMNPHAAAAPPTQTTLEGFLQDRLKRRPPTGELRLLQGDLRAVLTAADLSAVNPRRWTAPLLAALEWPGLPAAERIEPAQIDAVRAAAITLRGAARIRGEIRLPPSTRPAGPPALSKLAAIEDWEDEDWRRGVVKVRSNISMFHDFYAAVDDGDLMRAEDVRNNVDSFFKRSRGAWERAQFLYALNRLEALAADSRILTVSVDVDGFYLLLTELAAQVAVLDVGPRRAEHAARVAAGEHDVWLSKPRRYHRDRIAVHHTPPALTRLIPDGGWDAAALPQNTLLRADNPAGVLAWVDARLRMGGVVTLSTEIRLNDGRDAPGLAAAQACDAGFPALVASRAGWRPAGGFDASVSDGTLDRFVVAGTPDAANPHFIVRTGQTLHTTAVWTFVKQAVTPPAAWDGLVAELRLRGAC